MPKHTPKATATDDIADVIASRMPAREIQPPTDAESAEQFFIPLEDLQDLGLINPGANAPGVGAGTGTGGIADIIANRPAAKSNITGLSAPFSVQGVFSPIPLDEIQLQQAASDLLLSLEYSETFSRFSTEQIISSLTAMEMAPEVAYVLQNPAFLKDWQTSVWPFVMDAMLNGVVDGADNSTHMGIYSGIDVGDQDQLKAFGDMFFERFTSDEKDFFLNVVSATPSFEQLANEAIDAGRLTIYKTENDNVFSRMWNKVRTNASEMFFAPEVFAARSGSPRGNLLSLAALYLTDNDISDPEDREDFFLWLISHANDSAERSDRLAGGFDKLAQRTVGVPVTAIKGFIKETALSFNSPNNYMWRHDLTIGQNVAVDIGLNPNHGAWNKVTGTMDALNEFGYDPLTYAGGVAKGMKLTATGARTVSRTTALKAALNPHTASRIGVKAFDRRVIPRLWWAVLSKSTDDFVESGVATKGFEWLATVQSKASILDRYPSLKNIPDEELDQLVKADSVFEVREIWRGWMNSSSAFEVTPVMQEKKAMEFLARRGKYTTARAAALASGDANLRGLTEAFDGVYADEVFEVVRPALDAAGDAETLAGMRTTGGLLDAAGRLKVVDDIAGFTAKEAEDGTTHLFDDAGNWVAGLHPDVGSGAGSSIATAVAHQRKGIATALMDALEAKGIPARELLRKSDSVSDAATELLDEAAVVPTGHSLYRTTEFTGGGGARSVISTMGQSRLNFSDLNDPTVRAKVVTWLTQDSNDARKLALAAQLESGIGLHSLDEFSLKVLRDFAQADAIDGLRQGDVTLFGKNVDDMLLHGADDAVARSASEALPEEAAAMLQADLAMAPLRNAQDPNIYFMVDIPRRTLTNKIQEGMATAGRHLPRSGPGGRFAMGLRRMGFGLTHSLPSNISLTSGSRGSVELRNWIRFLGGGADLARHWQETFLAADRTTRHKVVTEAMEAVGKEIKNPHLRNSMIRFVERQGTRSFIAGRNGAQIGLTNDGGNLPLTIIHLTNELAMPEAKKIMNVVRRFQHAKDAKTPIFRQGFLKGTKDKRQAIVRQLKTEARTRGLNPDTMLDDGEDWITLAYADTLAAIGDRGRPDALGVVNKLAQMPASIFKAFHTAFTIGQLAFRPMAWGGRVLLEEGIRAELVQLPSMWSNPYKFISDLMDARAISKLTDDIAGQAAVLDGLVLKKLFAGGEPQWNAIRKVVPDIDDLLAKANVPPGESTRVQGFIAHLVGKSLIGGEAVTDVRIGSRFNWARRVQLKQRRIDRAHRTLDDAGLLQSFRWDTDALDITNRSLFSEFFEEVSTGYMDMEYRAGMMDRASVQSFGRGWGRQVFQMFNDDPIIRTYGLNRLVSQGTGATEQYGAARLVNDPNWEKIKPKVLEHFAGNNKTVGSELDLAEWYLKNVVDEISMTLLDDVANNNISQRVELAQTMLERGTYTAEYGDGIVHKIDFSSNNYEGVVNTFKEITGSRNSLNLPAPKTVSAVIDPRFGQKSDKGFMAGLRRKTTWIMQKFGEDATQALHRRPAYLAVHGRYYNYAIDMGATPEVARGVADEKATEIVNYIFFNNKDIPYLIKDMNKVIPFFSALFEVAQTWAWKIPAADGALGHATLLRKVDRTIDALHNVGILSTDEDGQMSVRGDPSGEVGFSKGLGLVVQAPAFLASHLVGLGRLMIEPFDADGVAIEPYKPADLSAWAKDGFTLAIGNPLDPSSHGIMAVNQLSLGVTPLLSYPLGKLTETTVAADTQIRDLEPGMTLGGYAEIFPDEELADMIFLNRDALEEINGKEAVARAFSGLGDPTKLEMPTFVSLPGTSLWETWLDGTVFPFGKMDQAGQVITSPVPAALQHVIRGFMTQFGEEESTMLSFMMGNMSQYQMTSEVIYSLQALEAEEGLASELMELGAKYMALAESTETELFRNPEGALTALDPDSPAAAALAEIREEIVRKEAIYLSRAHSNAAGSMILRGVQGSLIPATPRMFDWRQEEARAYWDQRNIAEEALVRGSVNYAELLKTLPRVTGDDLLQAHSVVTAFMQDPSGDAARVWVRKNNPSIEPFLLGKSYWDGGSPPPEALEIDQWVDDMRTGKRKPFNPEVWIGRLQRQAISVDKEIAVLTEYGNDSDVAMQAILMDYDRYKGIVDEFDIDFDAQDFLDDLIYDGAYKRWREDVQDDNVSQLGDTLDKLRFMQDAADALVDLLEYTELSPAERRNIRGQLQSSLREIRDAVEVLVERDPDTPWLNPRDKMLAKYWVEVETPYHEGRQDIFRNEVEAAVTGTQRSIGYDNLRLYDNEHFDQRHYVQNPGGIDVEVPNALLRGWNTKDAKEKEERIFALLAKKPEWLNHFNIQLLIATAPELETMLPVTDDDWKVYEEANNLIQNLQIFHEQNPEEVSASEVEARTAEIKEQRDEWLVLNGRGNEVGWREQWVPMQRLHFAGLLPPSLVDMMPILNSVLEALAAADKSPTTNLGTQYMLRLKLWLTSTYFPQHPTAREDLAALGLAMFDEPLESAVMARLFQDELFGKLE